MIQRLKMNLTKASNAIQLLILGILTWKLIRREQTHRKI